MGQMTWVRFTPKTVGWGCVTGPRLGSNLQVSDPLSVRGSPPRDKTLTPPDPGSETRR